MNLARQLRTSLAVLAFGFVLVITAPAQTVNTLATGVYSDQPLLQGVDGNLYGADYAGGPDAFGSLFKITPEGVLSTVHNFVTKQGGNYPTGLAIGLNGLLYGTTKQGGAQGAPCPSPTAGCGTVFEITAAGTISILHNFTGPDGMYPTGGLTLGPDGNFYGTTSGTNKSGATGAIYGTIFQITPAGTLTTLHTFSFTDGAYPGSQLVLGLDGRLYGTTPEGGSATGSAGTVFAITTGGTFTSLHDFDTEAAGGAPSGPLVYGANGNFFGTNTAGGTGCGNESGTIYYISPGGHQFVTFYQFGRICNDTGGNPQFGLVLASDGNFYGAASGTFLTGVANHATLFEITPKIDYTTLYTFDYRTGSPGWTNLMQSTNGTFYGTTTPDYPPADPPAPTVFSLSNGLSPFITTVPQMRPIGQKTLILGQGFTGATSVTFNGVSATFTVNSDTEISATVPKGATKGIVTVTTPSGTLSTLVDFYIG